MDALEIQVVAGVVMEVMPQHAWMEIQLDPLLVLVIFQIGNLDPALLKLAHLNAIMEEYVLVDIVTVKLDMEAQHVNQLDVMEYQDQGSNWMCVECVVVMEHLVLVVMELLLALNMIDVEYVVALELNVSKYVQCLTANHVSAWNYVHGALRNQNVFLFQVLHKKDVLNCTILLVHVKMEYSSIQNKLLLQ